MEEVGHPGTVESHWGDRSMDRSMDLSRAGDISLSGGMSLQRATTGFVVPVVALEAHEGESGGGEGGGGGGKGEGEGKGAGGGVVVVGEAEMAPNLLDANVAPLVVHHSDEAEQQMVDAGLMRSQDALTFQEHRAFLSRSGSVVFASTNELFGSAPITVPTQADLTEVADVHRIQGPDRIEAPIVANCIAARSALLIPFSFYKEDDEASPYALASDLLSRKVNCTHVSSSGQEVPLWEKAGLPKQMAEFSVHFRELVGFEAPTNGPVQRLKLTDTARTFLFSNARVWADTKWKSGAEHHVLAGKECDWTGVFLLIFRNGAILSIHIDWMNASSASVAFSLADLSAWTYVSKFRNIKVGVSRGWSFGIRSPLSDSDAEEQQQALGQKMYSCLYGGSPIALHSLCNWLVKLANESSGAIRHRITRFDYCTHHTYAQVAQLPDNVDEFVFRIRKAYSPADSSNYQDSKDPILRLRSNAMVAFAREGVFGLEWGNHFKRTFQSEFMGAFCLLSLHCLSERWVLDKLSLLAARRSQNLPVPGMEGMRSLDEMEQSRRDIMAVSSMLVRYRSSMASDDCGGRSAFREFFQALRKVYNIEVLRQALREEVQDMLSMVESDWMEKKRKEKARELEWKLRRDEISKRKDAITARQKRVFDTAYAAFTAIGLPFLIVANIWAMNNDDLPREVGWGNLMIACGVISIVLFLLIYYNFNRGRAEFNELSETEQLLNRLRLERLDYGQVSPLEEQRLIPAAKKKREPKTKGGKNRRIATLLDRFAKNSTLTSPLEFESVERDERELEKYLNDLQDAPFAPEFTGPPQRQFSVDFGEPAPPKPQPRRIWTLFSSRIVSSPPLPSSSSKVPTEPAQPERNRLSGIALEQSFINPVSRDFSFDIPRPMPPPSSKKVHHTGFLHKLGQKLKPAEAVPQTRPRSASTNRAPSHPEEVMERMRFSLDIQRDIPMRNIYEDSDDRGKEEADDLQPSRPFSVDIARSVPAPAKRRGNLFFRKQPKAAATTTTTATTPLTAEENERLPESAAMRDRYSLDFQRDVSASSTNGSRDPLRGTSIDLPRMQEIKPRLTSNLNK